MCSYYFKCFWIFKIKFWFWDNCCVMCSCKKWCRDPCTVAWFSSMVTSCKRVVKYQTQYTDIGTVKIQNIFHYQKYLFLFFVFWSYYAACGILASWPGIEPMPLHWKQSLNHWTILSLYNFILHTPPPPWPRQPLFCSTFLHCQPFKNIIKIEL